MKLLSAESPMPPGSDQSFKARGHVYSCGNGGSMCDAMHFAEELSGRSRQDRPALGAIAMGDGAHITCAGNDFGFDYIFSRFIEAQGGPGRCPSGHQHQRKKSQRHKSR